MIKEMNNKNSISFGNNNNTLNAKRIDGLDFLKGFAILWVVIEHALPKDVASKFFLFFPLKAVPIFFSITLYLMFMKFSGNQKYFRDWYRWERLWRMFKKVFIPFFIVLYL